MSTTTRTGLVLLYFLVLFQTQVFAQWTQVAIAPAHHEGYALAYDSIRRIVVMFGGTYRARETWEWNGEHWALAARTGPVNRISHALAYDRARGMVLLYGGIRIDEDGMAQETLGDMWAWDGSNWKEIKGTNPRPRYGHSMVYDRARQAIVLFGGMKENGVVSSETYIWNGQRWRKRTTIGPSIRLGHAMAYDRGRRRVVLYGGWNSDDVYSDTWEWDGLSWTEKYSQSRPGKLLQPSMAFDENRGVTVLIGRSAGGAASSTAWEWNGGSWRPGAVAGKLNLEGAAIAYDTARCCCVVFENNTECYPSTWLYDGTGWKFAAVCWPQPRSRPAMAYNTHRDKLVLFGGDEGTELAGSIWEWDGRTWKAYSAEGPRAREGCALVYDEGRKRTLMFGGTYKEGDHDYYFSDLWGWDSKRLEWTEILDRGAPSVKNAGAAYDPERGVVVVFGGEVENPYRTEYSWETWEWNGEQWARSTATGPKERGNLGMTYDGERRKVVLYGGVSESGWWRLQYCSDTWEWDGSTWTRINVAGPKALAGNSLVYDSNRRACVLFGGSYRETNWPNATHPFTETWVFDGKNWQRINESAPGAKSGHAAVFDRKRGEVVSFGGAGGSELWYLGANSPVAAHGSDFDGNGTSDIAVYEPDAALWHVKDMFDKRFGRAGDLPVCGDFGGSGKSGLGYFRPSIGYWKLKRVGSINGFGMQGDIPVPGDYDGDGRTDVAIYRPSTGRWSVYNGNNVIVGQSGDMPVPADYDGDGKTDMVVYRASLGKWVFYSGNVIEYGGPDDIPVPADYDGDGRAEIAVFKPYKGVWSIVGSRKRKLGRIGDIPVPADYDGDGKADVAVFRPATGEWIILGKAPVVFGSFGDIPIAGSR